jgi:hypothetical protein
MAVLIVIDQPGSGAPPGVAGQSREDLVTGFAVQLSMTGGPFLAQQWTIIDKAIDIVIPAQSAATLSAPAAPITLVAPIDREGTYLVQVAVDAGFGLGARAEDVDSRTFYAGATLNALNVDPAELPRREMAFRERTEHNVPDALFPLGNPRGWAEERQRWQAVLQRIYLGKSWAWGRVVVPAGGPATVLSGFNCAGAVWVAPGIVDISFTLALPNANYAASAHARGPFGGSATCRNELVGSFRVERADLAGVLVDADFTFDVKCFP